MKTTGITDIEIDGIDFRDYPDFVDAYISRACRDGVELTEGELEELNDDSGFVYESVMKEIF